MENRGLTFNILKDDLGRFSGKGPVFVTFGETMVRDTPADMQRLERTGSIYVSLAGSEFTVAVLLGRFGIPSAYITRVPDNPYGWMLRDTARSNGVDTRFIVWGNKAEPMGRLLYEIGRTPRKSVGWYQRMFSAASRLGPGMVKWEEALKDCEIFHTSGITFGLAFHSKYEKNFLLEAFEEALSFKPSNCKVGLDFNFRATLWPAEKCKEVMTPLVKNHVDILITTIEDMATVYGFPCGRYSPEEIDKGEMGEISDDDLKSLATRLGEFFDLSIVAITIRYPDSFEENRWESAVMDNQGNFFRSPQVKSITLLDRLGGGDTWNGGFYYGLLTSGFGPEGLEKGLLVGDAATRIKQTLMFDLPIITKNEVQEILKADVEGGGKRVSR
ncbi:MAG: sugar kinase [Caldiserica bacterium]|jgi:2-dehydro-3-deoxygluconokinase|nr:sugar kinase [Caldisericota bacterium]MDH7563198.1 sugar kinase [Caldisericota bacterium]